MPTKYTRRKRTQSRASSNPQAHLHFTKGAQITVILLANSPHNLVRRLINRSIVLIHRMIPTTRRTSHRQSNINSACSEKVCTNLPSLRLLGASAEGDGSVGG